MNRAGPTLTSQAGRRGAGFLAYWNDFATQQLYVFDRVLHTRTDVGQALLNFEPDLAVDGFTIAMADGEAWVVTLQPRAMATASQM